MPNEKLRFADVKGARAHIKANNFKVIQHVQHTRGERIQVVDPEGNPRTITIERPKSD